MGGCVCVGVTFQLLGSKQDNLWLLTDSQVCVGVWVGGWVGVYVWV